MEHLYEVNVEGESTSSVTRDMDYLTASIRARGGKLIKVWHGGATPDGKARLRDAARLHVRRLKRQGRISFYIYGEDLSWENEETRYLLDKYPRFEGQDSHFGTKSDEYFIICL